LPKKTAALLMLIPRSINWLALLLAAFTMLSKEGTEKLGVDAAQFVEVTTPKVLFEWMPQHAERTGTSRRSRAKKAAETGHRYHGCAVQVLQDGVVIGEACRPRSLQKAA
jgi:hypothetical protein